MTDLVLDAMRLAERAHRLRNHFRKAPEGEDRPAYFLHLAEVAWMPGGPPYPTECLTRPGDTLASRQVRTDTGRAGERGTPLGRSRRWPRGRQRGGLPSCSPRRGLP